MILAVFLIVNALFLGSAIYLMHRNQKVFELRQEITDKVFSHMDWQWRVDEYHKVSYKDMVYSFKPVRPESFWKDTSFLSDEVVRPVLAPYQLKTHHE